jgi:hypothetical protein
MKTNTLHNFLRTLLLLIGLGAFLFLLNAFLGKCTNHYGRVVEKRVVRNSQGHPFYRVLVRTDSDIVQVQTQPQTYPTINVGDSVNYTIRKGLFIPNVIERFNANPKK